QRVRVADATGGGHARRGQGLERAFEPLRGGAACAILVGRPEGDAAVQRGRDDENLGVAQVDGRVHGVARDGLVGDEQDPAVHRKLPSVPGTEENCALFMRTWYRRADRTEVLIATSEPSTKSDDRPSGSHQLPMSSALAGRPTVRE